MTLLEIYNIPKFGLIWFEPVPSELMEPWMWDNDGVIYVGF